MSDSEVDYIDLTQSPVGLNSDRLIAFFCFVYFTFSAISAVSPLGQWSLQKWAWLD